MKYFPLELIGCTKALTKFNQNKKPNKNMIIRRIRSNVYCEKWVQKRENRQIVNKDNAKMVAKNIVHYKEIKLSYSCFCNTLYFNRCGY